MINQLSNKRRAKLITYIQKRFKGTECQKNETNAIEKNILRGKKTTHPGGFNFTQKAWDTENRKLVKGSCMLEPFTDSLR